ncbi:MAG: phosphoribosyltransferase [Acidimicrobiia bacterium]|nr:phosphoribosyltransferase [Acidimicrobiia bacterium]
MPISLYEIPSPLHHLLKGYKARHRPRGRRELECRVGAMLGYFLFRHAACIAARAGPWDVVTTVPSSGLRAGTHPLVSAVRRVSTLGGQHEELLERGPAGAAHNRAGDDAFRVRSSRGGERILLLDDTFTTGARLQSAASALNRAGGRVVAAVVIGRVINPGWSAATRLGWEEQLRQHFSFESCCLGTRGHS